MTWLLALFAFFIPVTDPTRVLLGAGSASELLLVPLASFAAWRMLTVAPRPRSSIPLVLVLAFVAVAAASWIWNGGQPFSDVAPAWGDGVRPIEYGLVFLSLRTLLSTAARRRAYIAGMWAGCAMAVAFGLLHLALGPRAALFSAWGPRWTSYDANQDFRVYGSFGNPLNFAAYSATLLGISMSIAAFAPERTHRRVFAFTALLLSVVLAATGSKIAVAAFLVALLASWRRALAPLMVAVLLAVVASGATQVLTVRSTNARSTQASVLQRLLVYESAAKVVADHPWLGIGPGRFAEVYGRRYRMFGASNDPESFTAENMFLQNASELGVPASIALLVLILLTVARGFRRGAEGREETFGLGSRALATGLACYAVVALVQSMGSAGINLFLFSLLALADRMLLNQGHAPAPGSDQRALMSQTASASSP